MNFGKSQFGVIVKRVGFRLRKIEFLSTIVGTLLHLCEIQFPTLQHGDHTSNYLTGFL